MPNLPVDASKFAGMTEEQARSFPRRTVVGEEMTSRQLSQVPRMISTDSHVQEPEELWNELTARLRDNLPKVPFRNNPPGATDPHLRIKDQDTDGVAAEILFPNYGMALFALDDVETQEESFKLYNDWIHGFCKTDPKRLYGSPLVTCYDIKKGIKEMHRGLDMGLKGAMIWQVPDPRLPFTDNAHYDPLWAAAAEAGAPIVCHILTGHSYIKTGQKGGIQGIKDAVNSKTNDSANTLFDFIFSGAFDRHPKLRLLMAESEIGWLPFMLQQWDYYFERFRKDRPMPITRKPSEIFQEHVYGTFLEDYVGTRFFPWWGTKNCMWSNDYPHFNMTFPHSRNVVEHHLKGLDDAKRQQLTWDNAVKLFNLDLKQ